MELIGGAPPEWRVQLVGGAIVQVWADGVEGLSGPEDRRDYLFSNFMDVAPEQQGEFEIIGDTVPDQRRVFVAVARFPRACVENIWSA